MVGLAAVERVVAGLAIQVVAASATVDEVVAGAALAAVVATEQVKLVVAGVADEVVRALGAVAGMTHQVGRVPDRAVGELHLMDAAQLAAADSAVKAQHSHRAAIGRTQQQVRPVAPQRDLGGREAGVDQHPVQAGNTSRAAGGHRGIDDVGAAAVAEAVVVDAGAAATEKLVVAGAAVQRVGATFAAHHVVAAQGVDDVVAVGAGDDVVALGGLAQAGQYVGVHQRRVAENKALDALAEAAPGGVEREVGLDLDLVARHGAALQQQVVAAARQGEGGGGQAVEHQLVDGAGVATAVAHDVLSKPRAETIAVGDVAADQEVIAGAADEDIGAAADNVGIVEQERAAGAADERVVAGAARQGLGTGAADDDIVARGGAQHFRSDASGVPGFADDATGIQEADLLDRAAGQVLTEYQNAVAAGADAQVRRCRQGAARRFAACGQPAQRQLCRSDATEEFQRVGAVRGAEIGQRVAAPAGAEAVDGVARVVARFVAMVAAKHAATQDVIASTAFEHIVASAADQAVVAGTARQPVVAGVAAQYIAAAATQQRVIAAQAVDAVIATQRIDDVGALGASELVIALGGSGLMRQHVGFAPGRAVGKLEAIDERRVGKPARDAQ